MIKSILKTTFILFFLVAAHNSFAQEAVLITKEDVVAEGLIEDSYPVYPTCGDPREEVNKFSDVYEKTDKHYTYIVTEGTSAIVQHWSVRYRLLYAKKAYRDLDRYFSILMPSNWDNHHAVVVYYPDFPLHQELEEARNKCKVLTGEYCKHMVFYDKINAYCFPNISRYGPKIFDIFQYLQEQD